MTLPGNRPWVWFPVAQTISSASVFSCDAGYMRYTDIIRYTDIPWYYEMSWTNCDLKLSFGIVKTCSSCILMPYYPTSIDTGVVQQQYQLMNESISNQFNVHPIFTFFWPPIPISTPFIFCSLISLLWLPSQTPVIAAAAQLLRWSMRVIQQDITDPISSSWLLETKTSPHGSWFYGTSGRSFYSVKWGKRRRSIAYPWVKLRSYDIIFLQCYMLMFVKLSDWFQLPIWNQDRLR